jgi:hypothetical protein
MAPYLESVKSSFWCVARCAAPGWLHLTVGRLRRVNQLDIHRADPENGDHRRVAPVGRNAIVMWGASGPFHVTTRPDRYRVLRLKIIPLLTNQLPDTTT